MSANDDWRRRLAWREPGPNGMAIALRPGDEARAALALELDVEAAPALEADLIATTWRDGLEILGRLRATVIRTCGVSLDPFEEVIDETFAVRLVPLGSPNARAGETREILIDPDQADPPDEVDGPGVDLAAVVSEQLALALDPFPRKPGAVFEPPAPESGFSPFAALARLKERQDKA